ncbi:MAG: hypothetical protein H6926_06420 [Chromatiales bacterium]|nr:hypothetical protein [Gammaproteobacteria bacterium]MCP5352805.1 hypothetical protein [Chromatiales bacterium]
MVNISDNLWFWVLGLSLALGHLLAFSTGWRWQQYRAARDARPSVAPEALKAQIEQIDAALHGIDTSLNVVDRSMAHYRDAEKLGALRPEQQLHDQAIRIAEHLAEIGLTKDQIVRTTGITPGEATMIHRLHTPAA